MSISPLPDDDAAFVSRLCDRTSLPFNILFAHSGSLVNRDPVNVRQRAVIYYILHAHYGWSFPRIARACGLRSHSTVHAGHHLHLASLAALHRTPLSL